VTPESQLPESQPQRTRFAWRRTQLALGAAALLTVVMVVRRDSSPVALAGLLVIVAVVGLGLLLAGQRVAAMARPEIRPLGRAGVGLALVVVAIAVFSAAIVVIS
jgi:hypothetical protein